VPWGPLLPLFVMGVSFFGGRILASMLVSLYPFVVLHWTPQQVNDWQNNSTFAQFAFTVLAYGIVAAAIWAALFRTRDGWRHLGWIRPRVRDGAWAIIGFAGYFVIYLTLLSVTARLVHLDVNQQQEIGFTHVYGPLSLVLTFVSLVVIPPIVEETVFRGFLYPGLKRWMTPVFAALVTSLIFGALHLGESSSGPLWVGGLDTFTLSLMLCYLRERTGGLWASAGVHALKNGMAFVVIFILHVR
jgi:membrane protease YdiL (CAAX protease family)